MLELNGQHSYSMKNKLYPLGLLRAYYGLINK